MLACRVVPRRRWLVPAVRRPGGRCVTAWPAVWRTSRWGGGPTTLVVTVRRYACKDCGQDVAAGHHRGSRTESGPVDGGRWPGRSRRSWSGISPSPGSPTRSGCRGTPRTTPCWPKASRVLISDPARFDGVRVHRRRRARLAPHPGGRQVRHGHHRPHPRPRPHRPGPAARHGRGPLQADVPDLARPNGPRRGGTRIEVVAMDGFTGFKTAAVEPSCPTAVTVMDPFHVVRLAGDALDGCRRRVQQDLHGHRGRAGDPLYAARRTLHTGADSAHRPPEGPSRQAVRRRRATSRSRSPGPSISGWSPPTATPTAAEGRKLMVATDRQPRHRRPRRTRRAGHPRPDPQRNAPLTCSPTSTGPAPATAPPRPSTAASSTSAAQPSASGTSPTTSPDASSRPAASDPTYTLNCEEPVMAWAAMAGFRSPSEIT